LDLNTFELRNYRIQPDLRDAFIDYFEAHFIFSQLATKMSVLGQFRVSGQPDQFVWLRGFADMATRLAGLQTFYGGTIWKKYRGRANEMIADSDQVHLLRPLGSAAALTGGRTPMTVAGELRDGTISPDTGLIVVDFFQTEANENERLPVNLAESYRSAGIQVRAVLAAEMAANDFPRLPVIQQPGEFVIISAYAAAIDYQRQSALVRSSAAVAMPHNTLVLRPTLRSPLRW